MGSDDSSIRENLLTTLGFFASEAEQRDFANKVHYDSYQDEFDAGGLMNSFQTTPAHCADLVQIN